MKTKKAERKALEAQAKAQQAARRKAAMKATVVVLAVTLAFVGLPMLIASALVMWILVKHPDRLYTRLAMLIGAIPASLAFVLLGSYWEAYTAVLGGDGSVASVITLVTFGCAFAPLFGGFAAKAFRSRAESSPLNGPAAVAKRREMEDSRRSKGAQRLQKWAYTPAEGRVAEIRRDWARGRAVPLGEARGPYLGRYLDGDLGEPWQSKKGGFALLNAQAAGPAVVAVGRTGSGKSETVLRIAEWALETEESQVIYLNGKEAAPGKEPSRRLLAHAESLGVTGRVLVPSVSPWDFMRGTPAQVRNRLMDAELFSEPHHEAGTNMTLAFGLHKLAMEGRPAGQITDVMRELANRKQVAQWAAHDPFAAQLLNMVDERSWNGAVQRYTANAMDLQGWTGPAAAGGWGFEDARLCCIDLPTSSERRAARMMLRFALSDLEAYLKDESRRPRRWDGAFVALPV